MESCISLNAHSVFKTFMHRKQQISILKGITQKFKSDTTYALMGPSGTGKSTFLHLLAGLDMPSQGIITVGGQNLCELTPQQRAQTLGFVFQNPLLIGELTVLENVALAGTIVGKSLSESNDLAQGLLVEVGLGHTLNWRVGQLSGGQRQRVSLARALLNKPQFLLADELTGNLDYQTSLKLVELLLKLQKEWKMGLILSSHNLEIASMMEFVFLLKDGNLVAEHGKYAERGLNESGCRP